jgi:hypothetical protein
VCVFCDSARDTSFVRRQARACKQKKRESPWATRSRHTLNSVLPHRDVALTLMTRLHLQHHRVHCQHCHPCEGGKDHPLIPPALSQWPYLCVCVCVCVCARDRASREKKMWCSCHCVPVFKEIVREKDHVLASSITMFASSLPPTAAAEPFALLPGAETTTTDPVDAVEATATGLS